MGTPPMSDDLARQAWDIVLECAGDGFKLEGNPSAKQEAARRAIQRGIVRTEGAFQTRIRTAVARGFAVATSAPEPAPVAPKRQPEAILQDVRRQLRSPKTAEELKRSVNVSGDELADAIEALRDRGVAVRSSNGHFEISVGVQPAYAERDFIEIVSRSDNTFVFGVAGDKHIGAKYHRDDVLADLYRRFAAAEVDAIFDTGNWIDGDARFNRHDLIAHGLDPQLKLMAETHPRIEGTPTYAVWGDDHEGWYAQREGIDVGRYAEGVMRTAGHDWTDLGFMEAHVRLVNANTGKSALLCVMHPGGGSAYALSYRPQKIIESMEGGEKPAAIFMGHYHKLEALNVRNIWSLQAGCCEDQTPFMRKKSIEAHVGGAIVRMEQDPETGALIGFAPEMIRYFNRGYHNGRWSHHGPVSRPERAA